MKRSYIGSLPRSSSLTMMRARPGPLVLALLWAASATAQEKAEPKREELDVTMQIITDPDAKLPEEVVRRIPLPAPKPAPAAAPGADTKRADDPAAKGQERARDAKEQGKDMAERGKERAREATEQREQAERSRAEEKRRNPPKDPPGRPNEPPRR